MSVKTGLWQSFEYPRVKWSADAATCKFDPALIAALDADVVLPNGAVVTVTDVRFEEREVRKDEQGEYVVFHWSGEFRPNDKRGL